MKNREGHSPKESQDDQEKLKFKLKEVEEKIEELQEERDNNIVAYMKNNEYDISDTSKIRSKYNERLEELHSKKQKIQVRLMEHQKNSKESKK